MKKLILQNTNKFKFIMANLLLLSVVFGFQNCGKSGFEVSDEFNIGSINEELVKYRGDFTENCLENDNYDICLYYKNPLVHPSQFYVLNPEIEFNNQVFGANLGEPLESLELKNDHIIIKDKDGNLVTPFNDSWKTQLSENDLFVQEIMSFYWGSYFLRYMSQMRGEYALSNGVNIVVGSNVTGWSYTENSIFISNNNYENPMGLDASVIIHLLAEASIGHGTSGEIYNLASDTNHSSCGVKDGPLYEDACCTSQLGCSKAITSGLSDYFVATAFPDFPAVADYFVNNDLGKNVCGIQRNVAINYDLNVDGAYNACSDRGDIGNIYTMGSVFSALLWSIRQDVYNSPVETPQEFDVLIVSIIPLLDGDDNFLDVKEKLLLLDQEDFSEQFGSFIEAEFERRGITN